MIALERDASLRIQPGTRVEIACLAGVVWITDAGDPRDLFLARGESLVLSLRGVTLITALEPATVRVVECAAPSQAPATWWAGIAHAVRGLLRWLRSSGQCAISFPTRRAGYLRTGVGRSPAAQAFLR